MSAMFGDPRLPERFWSKVARRSSDCWEWQGALNSKGYGNFSIGNGRTGHSHRVAYIALIGSIAPQLELDHLCRNRSCVNPAHMEAVSGRVNNLRGNSLAAQRARRTHCPRGHALKGANLDPAELKRSGNRSCYHCALDRSRTRSALIVRASKLVGLTQAEYRRRFGQSAEVARRLLGGAEALVEAS